MGFQESFNRVFTSGSADRAFGVSVTLTQGTGASESFNAQWEAQEFEIEDSDGYATKFHGRDFMFAKSDAVIASVEVRPRAGDRITLTENSETQVFEIMPIGQRPAVEAMDGQYRWLVHTKRVG